MLAYWLTVWVLALAWSARAVPVANAGTDFSSTLTWTGWAILAAVVLGLPVSGFIGARTRRWGSLLLVVWLVWALSLLWYVGSMLDGPDTSGSDDAAGAGLVILGIPALGVIILLAALGAGIGVTANVVAQRRR
jgi:hypothetical protein